MNFYQYELYKKTLDLKFNENLLIYHMEKAEFYHQQSENSRKQNIIKKLRKIMSRRRRRRKKMRILKSKGSSPIKEKSIKKRIFLSGALCFLLSGNLCAQVKPEIVTVVRSAVQYVNDHGEEIALKAFSDPNGPFTMRDTYVFAMDLKGNILAHGREPARIGQNYFDEKDPQGRSYIRALVERAKYGRGGWVSYYRKNPSTQEYECKSSYVTTVDKKIVIGAGYTHPLNKNGKCLAQ